MDETLLSSWQEPEIELAAPRSFLMLVGSIALGIATVLIGIGIFTHTFTMYLAAGVALAAGLLVISQNRTPAKPMTITLTTSQLQVGSKPYSLMDLAGFWVEPENGYTVVNVEPKKPAPFPITFLYPGSGNEACDTLLQVIAEVEPRKATIADTLSRYIRL